MPALHLDHSPHLVMPKRRGTSGSKATRVLPSKATRLRSVLPLPVEAAPITEAKATEGLLALSELTEPQGEWNSTGAVADDAAKVDGGARKVLVITSVKHINHNVQIIMIPVIAYLLQHTMKVQRYRHGMTY